MVARRRQLRTAPRNVVGIVDRRRIEPKTRQAFLALDYPGVALSAFVQFNDPTFVRGNVLQARLRPGLGGAPLAAGTPVTVQITHGQVEIVGLPGGSGSPTSTALTADVALPALATPASSTGGVERLTELPDLPSDDYPPGSVINLITTGKDHRNEDDVWEAYSEATDVPDMPGTIGQSHAAGISDPYSGTPLIFGNTDPTADDPVGAAPFLYNEWKRLIRNGDFHDPPPHPELPIDNEDNKLPGWEINGSFVADPAYWVPDTTSGSGGKIVVYANGVCTTGFYQNVSVRSSSTRNNSVALIVSGQAGHHTTSQIAALVSGLDSAGGALTPDVINDTLGFGTDSTLDDVVFKANIGIPAATHQLLVFFAVTTSVTDTVTITEAQLVEGPPIGVHPDIGDPTNAPATDVYDTGVWTFTADAIAFAGMTDLTVGGATIYRVGGTDVAVADGGTGASTAANARTNLGLGTGDTPQFAALDIGGTAATLQYVAPNGDLAIEGNLIYRAGGTDVPVTDGGTGASTASAARSNLGAYGSGDSPTFSITSTTTIELGATDTTLARSSAGNVSVEGNLIYRAGGTDVPVTDGGTGASTAASAATNLGLGTGDSPQFTAVNIGAATDTTVGRTSAGVINVEGKDVYMVGGADVAVADGGTGASTAAGAATNLGLGTGDSPQFAGINVGHASDTTITRVSAGVIAVEGNTVLAGSSFTGFTLTNTIFAGSAQFNGSNNTLTGTQAAVDLTAGNTRIRWNGATHSQWQGIVAEATGTVHILTNVTSSFNLTLKNLNGGASAANQITTPGGVDFVLGPGDGCWISYDATLSLWRILEQSSLRPASNLSDLLSVSTALTNLGLGTGDSPQFTAVNIGNASDTTLSRASAGDLNVEGNLIYRAGGTDVPITDGGTGASTAAGARSNLGSTTVGDAVFIAANAGAARTALALGTMATQAASAVAITGGTAASLSLISTTVSVNSTTGSQTTVSLSDPKTLWNGGGAATWHGITAVATDELHSISNVTSTQVLTIKHQSGTASAANRVVCPNGVDLILSPFSSVWISYDSSFGLWRVISASALMAENSLSELSSPSTARTNLGLGTADTPTFTGVNVGNADTTLTRASAGDVNVEGNLIYRAGGTDVPVADGGTGASTASTARTNLGLVIGTDVAATPHGAADHTDVTREVWLYPNEATLDGGTLTGLGTTPDRLATVSLADGASQGLYWTFGNQSDYTSGNFSIQVFWAAGTTDAVSHAVRWSADIKVIGTGGTDVTAAGTSTAWTGNSGARTINLSANETAQDLGVAPSAATDRVMLNLRRIGANAADTYVGVVHVWAVRVTYTANQ